MVYILSPTYTSKKTEDLLRTTFCLFYRTYSEEHALERSRLLAPTSVVYSQSHSQVLLPQYLNQILKKWIRGHRQIEINENFERKKKLIEVVFNSIALVSSMVECDPTRDQRRTPKPDYDSDSGGVGFGVGVGVAIVTVSTSAHFFHEALSLFFALLKKKKKTSIHR